MYYISSRIHLQTVAQLAFYCTKFFYRHKTTLFVKTIDLGTNGILTKALGIYNLKKRVK